VECANILSNIVEQPFGSTTCLTPNRTGRKSPNQSLQIRGLCPLKWQNMAYTVEKLGSGIGERVSNNLSEQVFGF
jgi:hypothetical protein